MTNEVLFKMKDDRFITSQLYFPNGNSVGKIVYNISKNNLIEQYKDAPYMFVEKVTKKGYYFSFPFFSEKAIVFITHKSLERINV